MTAASTAPERVDIAGLGLDPITEAGVVDVVAAAWEQRRGGLIVTPNVDIWLRARKDPVARGFVERADLVVADGQPLVWASRLSRTPVPERVAGSSLVESLCRQAALSGRSVFVLGGGAGNAAELAAERLSERYPGLRVAGTLAPPFDFEREPATQEQVVSAVVDTRPDLVLVGLGFPKQEALGYALAERLPHAWMLGCGGGIEMSAGSRSRSPRWVQRIGAEWIYRMVQDPRRLARRYLVDDVPAALTLLLSSARQGRRSKRKERR